MKLCVALGSISATTGCDITTPCNFIVLGEDRPDTEFSDTLIGLSISVISRLISSSGMFTNSSSRLDSSPSIKIILNKVLYLWLGFHFSSHL